MPELGVYLVNPALQRVNRRLLDVFRRIEVRFACAKSADVDTLRFHRFGFAVDREGERRSELSGAAGNFHGSRISSEIVQNGSANYWRR